MRKEEENNGAEYSGGIEDVKASIMVVNSPNIFDLKAKKSKLAELMER